MSIQIHEKIHTLRKQKNMTQEQLANALGVTAPAVNKWEKGNSCPDIALLAPLARVLDTTLDELLSFQMNLTDDEVMKKEEFIRKIYKKKGFEAGYEACENAIKEYPNCICLKYRLAALIAMQIMISGVGEQRVIYNNRVRELYEETAASDRKEFAEAGKVSLLAWYIGEDQSDKAEEVLNALPEPTYEKRELQASIYIQQNKIEEARKVLEIELYQKMTRAFLILGSLTAISLNEGRFEDTEEYIRAQQILKDTFKMKHFILSEKYLSLALKKEDKEQALTWLEEYLNDLWNVDYDYSDSFYFSSVKLKESTAMKEQMQQMIQQFLKEDSSLDMLRGEERFEKLIVQFTPGHF